MFFRTLLFFIVIYLLIKVLSRLFLRGISSSKKGTGFFYQNFQHPPNRKQRKNSDSRFEEIEEAEFEDITDEEKSEAKRSD